MDNLEGWRVLETNIRGGKRLMGLAQRNFLVLEILRVGEPTQLGKALRIEGDARKIQEQRINQLKRRKNGPDGRVVYVREPNNLSFREVHEFLFKEFY